MLKIIRLLVSNRIDRNDVKPNSVSNNNFIGVNIFKKNSKKNEIICAPYGGLFIPKNQTKDRDQSKFHLYPQFPQESTFPNMGQGSCRFLWP